MVELMSSNSLARFQNSELYEMYLQREPLPLHMKASFEDIEDAMSGFGQSDLSMMSSNNGASPNAKHRPPLSVLTRNVDKDSVDSEMGLASTAPPVVKDAYS